MTIGMSVTVSEIEVPSSAVRPTGSTRASPSASRSRKSCVSSLRAWAMMRRMVPTPSGGERALLRNGEKDVLERVVLLDYPEDADAVAGEPFLEPAHGGLRVGVDDDVEAVAEQRHAPRLHLLLEHGDGAQRVVGANFEHAAALGRLHAARRALELAGHHEAQPVALLG